MRIGQKIRFFRKKKGMTLEVLSEAICSVSYLSKTETGKIEASPEILALLGKRLGINLIPEESLVSLNNFREELYKWYECIITKNEKAHTMYTLLRKEIQQVEAPDLLSSFYLFELRYLLSCGNITESENKLEKLKDIREIFTKEQEYYYNKFNGLFYYLNRAFKEALNHINIAEGLLKDCIVEEYERADLYYLKGLATHQLYQITASNNYIEQALNFYNKNYNLTRSAECLILLSINYRRISDIKNAEHHLLKALNISRATSNNTLEGLVCHTLGKLSYQRENYLESITMHKRALEKFTDGDDLLRCTYCIALCHYMLEEFNEFYKWKLKGIRTAEKEGNYEQLLHFQLLNAREYCTEEEFEVLLSEKAIPFFLNKEDWKHTAQFCEELADFYSEKHKYKLAAYYYKIAYESFKNITLIYN
ncbi:helix-turn-helix domain-containing protein [Bacillus pseudomycoides]|uniref:helix-turn-helix domain-containing protein n=1 Tax=Bacillus pseudomycoides TaxID=64104 RepID=UPI001FB477D6|nr:helix-turn-helix transcriptional regulator [Bacillus pseudomycoides]